jgi:hypothetical protein
LAQILEDKETLAKKQPDAEVVIINGSALVNSTHPKISKSFDEYASLEFVSKVQFYYSRSDV